MHLRRHVRHGRPRQAGLWLIADLFGPAEGGIHAVIATPQGRAVKCRGVCDGWDPGTCNRGLLAKVAYVRAEIRTAEIAWPSW